MPNRELQGILGRLRRESRYEGEAAGLLAR